MAGELGGYNASYVDIKARTSVNPAPSGWIRLWCNSSDSNNFYVEDEAGNNIQVTNGAALATGNAQYNWDWFYNGLGVAIPDYAAVRLISGGASDGMLALSDNDAINEDNFLGLVYDGPILPGTFGKVIYTGKVPNAVQGLGYNSNTIIYMSDVPGEITALGPDFITKTVFQIGFTSGDHIYLRPRLLSGL